MKFLAFCASLVFGLAFGDPSPNDEPRNLRSLPESVPKWKTAEKWKKQGKWKKEGNEKWKNGQKWKKAEKWKHGKGNDDLKFGTCKKNFLKKNLADLCLNGADGVLEDVFCVVIEGVCDKTDCCKEIDPGLSYNFGDEDA